MAPRPSERVQAARRAEEDYRNALEGLATFEYSGRIKAPPRLRREAVRFGGRYRGGGERGTSGLYDWFYELDPAEQARIRQNWMAPTGNPVDELEENLPIGEWLALTRRIDASRALATGRQLSRKRYGGLTAGDIVSVDRARRQARSLADEAVYGDRRCRFFTDDEGVVHPIRATCGDTTTLGRYTPNIGGDEDF